MFHGSPGLVADLLAPERYSSRWPLIPEQELLASCVDLSVGTAEGSRRKVLMHKRRVDAEQADGKRAVCVCEDCFEAFRGKKPWLCKYSLANDMWLGRWDPLFRGANLSHQMLLALGRIVTTKIVLRPQGQEKTAAASANKWDFLFHQSGMIGSAVVFSNADCGHAEPGENLRCELRRRP